MISVDEKVFEFWSTVDYEYPKSLKFKSKIDTDFMCFVKEKSEVLSCCLSFDGKHVLTFDSLRQIKLFSLKGTLI